MNYDELSEQKHSKVVNVYYHIEMSSVKGISVTKVPISLCSMPSLSQGKLHFVQTTNVMLPRLTVRYSRPVLGILMRCQ